MLFSSLHPQSFLFFRTFLHKRLPNQPLIFANYISMFTICQHFYTLCGEERRRNERIMSRCLTWVPFGGLGKPKLYQNMWCFTRKWDFTWRVSDSVKNQWGLLTGDDGVGLVDLLIPMFIHYGIFDFISYKSFCTHM